MFVCPYDAHWCQLQDCRAGVCQMTGELPLIACISCGAVVERARTFRVCVACVIDVLPNAKQEV
jgi:hypothetical protein